MKLAISEESTPEAVEATFTNQEPGQPLRIETLHEATNYLLTLSIQPEDGGSKPTTG